MSPSDLRHVAHRRFNPLIREWVLVSPHLNQRPWLGKVEAAQKTNDRSYDPNCYLCPGNERANGIRNPPYERTYMFDNDYPALLPERVAIGADEAGLLIGRSESGNCRVLCFFPRHDLTISRMSQREVREVVGAWSEQFKILDADSRVGHVQIFENRGALMGASNPHPHCQIWASKSLPNIPQKELISFLDYIHSRKSCLLCDYVNYRDGSKRANRLPK